MCLPRRVVLGRSFVIHYTPLDNSDVFSTHLICTIKYILVNVLRCLKVSEDTWLTEEVEIKNHIRDNYKNLYITELPMSPITSNVSGFSCCFLDERTRACLERGLTEDEIRAGLWALKPFKAPGPDGLHAGFYQRF